MNMQSFAQMPLHGGIHLLAGDLPPEDQKRRKKYKRPPAVIENWKVTRTRYEILVNWSDIKDSSRRSTKAGFEQIIALCKAAQKDEFVVEDIAPGFVPGSGDPKPAMAAQERIVGIFMQAAKPRFRRPPEHRLSLRRGVMDLRFYVGRTLPTDIFISPDEDY